MDLEMRVRIRAQATLTPHVGKTSLRYCFTGLAWLWWVRRGIVLACVWSLGCATMSIRMEGTSRVPKIVGTASDSQDLETLVRSMDSLMAWAKAQGYFNLGEDQHSAVSRRNELQGLLVAFLDHAVALDSSVKDSRHDDNHEAKDKLRGFLFTYVAGLSLYINTAHFLAPTLGEKSYEAILGESALELGLPAGAWQDLKTAFSTQGLRQHIHVWDARHREHMDAYEQSGLAASYEWMFAYIDERQDDIHMIDANMASDIDLRFLADTVERGLRKVWFPAQAGVAQWMSDTKIMRVGSSLISSAQIEQLRTHLRPGDILLERRNWYLSNVGLPGFWPHAALYLGTPDEFAQIYGLESVEALKKQFPNAFKSWFEQDENGAPHRVFEALSEGVVFTSLERSASADYVAALRPRLEKTDIFIAARRAFEFFGRPYDFDFDFLTDASLVCTELIYKAYEDDADGRGIYFPLVDVLGRPTLPPNEIVRYFDQSWGTSDQSLEFVYFLDGRELLQRAVVSDVESFRASHRRSKWDLAQP
jgi:hypothetical protein